MRVALMVTNGGPHPAEKLAGSTAWKIVDLIRISDEPVSPDLPAEDRLTIETTRESYRQARAVLEDSIKAILETHHGDVQHSERGAIAEAGSARLSEPHGHDCGFVCAEIIAATRGTVLEAHFARPETQERIKAILDHDSAHNAHVERSWHADRNPDDRHCLAFKARHAGADAPVAA